MIAKIGKCYEWALMELNNAWIGLKGSKTPHSINNRIQPLARTLDSLSETNPSISLTGNPIFGHPIENSR